MKNSNPSFQFNSFKFHTVLTKSALIDCLPTSNPGLVSKFLRRLFAVSVKPPNSQTQALPKNGLQISSQNRAKCVWLTEPDFKIVVNWNLTESRFDLSGQLKATERIWSAQYIDRQAPIRFRPICSLGEGICIFQFKKLAQIPGPLEDPLEPEQREPFEIRVLDSHFISAKIRARLRRLRFKVWRFKKAKISLKNQL